MKFGQAYANELRRRPHCGDTWHLDAVFLSIRGERHSLWRAVDQDGNVLISWSRADAINKRPRDFSANSLKACTPFRVIVTDKLKNYAAAKRKILLGVEHRQHKGLNNRAENFHQSTRLREKKMRRFQSAKHAQRFLLIAPIAGPFQPRRQRLSAEEYRATLQSRFQIWNEITGVKLVS